jgi:hypothetical protein
MSTRIDEHLHLGMIVLESRLFLVAGTGSEIVGSVAGFSYKT